MKNLFDRLDVLGEDVKQKYITNLAKCNDAKAVEVGYVDWCLYDTGKYHKFDCGFEYSKSSEGHDFWMEQQKILEEHGFLEQYNPDGNLEFKATLDDGELEGVKILLDGNGKVVEEKIMQSGIDITNELMALMLDNDGYHMLKAGIITDGAQEFKTGELSQKIYDYYKINNLKVESAMKSSFNVSENVDVNKILKMNPESECKITYIFFEEWRQCYYQTRNENHKDINTNELPVLNDNYTGDCEVVLLCNDEDEYVFDPSQEIEYETFYDNEIKFVYKSKTFVGLLQKQINELIKTGEYDPNDENSDFFSCLDFYHSPDFLFCLRATILCDDIICVEGEEYNGYDKFLWLFASGIDTEYGELYIEEI